MGQIYKRGERYWIKYYRNGKSYREATHSRKKSDAEHRLKMREGQIEMGTFAGLQMEKTTWDDLAKDLENDYKINGFKSFRRLTLSLSHLTISRVGSRRILPRITSKPIWYKGRKRERAMPASTGSCRP